MKFLEEVIKYKLDFLPIGIDPFYAIQTYTAERGPNPTTTIYDIYETKEEIFSNDSFSFMEDITPLFIYISSCDKYYRENGHGEIYDIVINLFMVDGELMFGSSNAFGNLDEHRISDFKEDQNSFFSSVGYCARYTKPFKILFEGFFSHFQTEEERLEAERRDSEIQEEVETSQSDSDDREIQEEVETSQSYSDDSDDEEKEELSINDFKTFKLEQRVICLEEEPKVLFCNCGHICICEKCASHRYNNCPVCKKENTILRIRE